MPPAPRGPPLAAKKRSRTRSRGGAGAGGKPVQAGVGAGGAAVQLDAAQLEAEIRQIILEADFC